jgi:hypothetical protein
MISIDKLIFHTPCLNSIKWSPCVTPIFFKPFEDLLLRKKHRELLELVTEGAVSVKETLHPLNVSLLEPWYWWFSIWFSHGTCKENGD